jgi:hypothetical protein
MIAARRTTRFITALAFAGVMLGSSPLAPGALAASSRPSSSRFDQALFCEHIAQAIARLQAQPPGPLVNFLLRQLYRLDAAYCS